jgi:hypothetical protein
MTTAEQLIEKAWSRSAFNDPDDDASPAELISVLDRVLKGVYSLAAGINRWYFAEETTVAPASSKWAIPTDATVVHLIQTTARVRVHEVPRLDTAAARAPRVYRLGRAYYTVGGVGDPSSTADSLILTHSVQHPNLDPAAAASAAVNTLDASWPEHFNGLLIAELARFLAAKDERTGSGEVQLLDAEIEKWTALFTAEVQAQQQGITRRFDE